MKAVNLLPSDRRPAAKPAKAGAVKKTATSDGFGAYALLGALGLAVIGSAAFALTSSQVSDREASLARVAAERQTAEAKVASLKPYGDFQQLATQRVSTVVSLATSRFDWDQALADLSRALPADVRLSKVDGKAGAAAAGSGAAATPGTAAATPKIELSGCTTSHTGTARLMARLRAVRGVTRVVLTKSDKETLTAGNEGAGGSAGAPTGGSTQQVSLCGRGAKPTFQISMLFERANVVPSTPSAAPVAGAPAAGGTPNAQQQAGQAGQPAQPGPGATQPASTQPGTAGAQPATSGGTTP